MNIMLMVVTERTFEIGLRKALGAKRRDIMLQVLTESVTLSVAGGIVGTTLGFLLAWIISSVSPLPAAVQPWSVVLGHRHHGGGRPVLRRVPGHARGAARSDRSAEEGVAMAMRFALFTDIIGMAFDTLRANKLRAALTILGVVIGITAIVGMTSLIRGFDESLRDSIRELGPEHAVRREVQRPELRVGQGVQGPHQAAGAHRGRRQGHRARSAVGRQGGRLAGRLGQPARERAYYKGEKTKELSVIGVSENYAAVNFLKIAGGRFFTESEVEHRRNLAVLGDSPVKALFPNVDPVGKTIRDRQRRSTRSSGYVGPRPSAGGARQRPGRLHRHPVHDLPEAVRVAAVTGRRPRRRHA